MNSQGGASHDPQVRPQTQPRCRPATIGQLLQSQLRSQDSARQDERAAVPISPEFPSTRGPKPDGISR